jgi:hypothetical protein
VSFAPQREKCKAAKGDNDHTEGPDQAKAMQGKARGGKGRQGDSLKWAWSITSLGISTWFGRPK